MQMTATVELSLIGPMDHLRLAWQAGECLLEQVPFHSDPEETRYNTLLAVQEMLTNVLRHAYGGDETLPVKLRYECTADAFAVTIMDKGEAFDPREHRAQILDDAEMPSSAGGYGIMIATMVMDEVDYARVDGWNVLTMTKQTANHRAPAETLGGN